MKLKILSLGWSLENPSIDIETFQRDVSLDEYDVVLINPTWIDEIVQQYYRVRGVLKKSSVDTFNLDWKYWEHVGKKIYQDIIKKREELKNVIVKNNGIIVCKLLPNTPQLQLEYGSGLEESYLFDRYAFLPGFRLGKAPKPEKGKIKVLLPSPNFPNAMKIKEKRGYTVNINERSPLVSFFKAFKNEIEYKAVIQENIEDSFNGTTLATNKVGDVISAFFPIKSGGIIFLPDLKEPDPRKEAGVLLELINQIYELPVSEEPPSWISKYHLPHEDKFDIKISGIKKEIQQKEEKLNELLGEKESIVKYKGLLWGTGKRGLEPIVREAFRLIGFDVPGPDEYEDDYDALLYSSEGNAIAEIEGSEGMIDVYKYRQLLDYVENEYEKGDEFKGILVGNGYRSEDPDEREDQFTEKARESCLRRRFCILPTTELFKIVQRVMKDPENDETKREIRTRILDTEGDFVLDDESQNP